MKKQILGEAKNLLMIFIAALCSFSALHVFVIPSNFSPSGVDGISTIIYELTNINIGWFKLGINLPLMVIAWFVLKKRYVIYVSLFTILDSLGVIFLEKIDFYTFVPSGLTSAEELAYRLISAIFSGVSIGVCTGIMLKLGASTGGVDIVASLISRKNPHIHIERIISIFCYTIIACSYFVYWDLTSVLLSVIQIFVFEWTAATLLKKDRYAIEVKVITKQPEAIRDEILHKFNHSATILKANGMFTGDDYYMVITLLDSKNAVEFMNIMKRHTDTFAYFTDGAKVQGDFHFGEQTVKVK